MASFTKEVAERIGDAITEGTHTIAQICVAVKISRPTYYRWLQDETKIVDGVTFDTYIKSAKERGRVAQKDIAISSFMKTLQGYSYDEVTVERRYDPKDPDKEPEVYHTKTVTKHVGPHGTVVIFAMKNYYPEDFKDKIEVEGKELTYEQAFAIKYGKQPPNKKAVSQN